MGVEIGLILLNICEEVWRNPVLTLAYPMEAIFGFSSQF